MYNYADCKTCAHRNESAVGSACIECKVVLQPEGILNKRSNYLPGSLAEQLFVEYAPKKEATAVLKDSGARRDFGTGAVRDMGAGKGRCDLLPLVTVECLLKSTDVATSSFLHEVNNCLSAESSLAPIRATLAFCRECNVNVHEAILMMARQLEDGAKKYGARNWEAGIPIVVFYDSAIRHYIKWLRGDTDEPHDRAVIWNLLAAHHTYWAHPALRKASYDGTPETAKEDTTCESTTEPLPATTADELASRAKSIIAQQGHYADGLKESNTSAAPVEIAKLSAESTPCSEAEVPCDV